MYHKRFILPLTISVLFISCWKVRNVDDINIPPPPTQQPQIKVWGFKPVYGTETEAKNILYSPGAKPVINGGNIYAYQQYLFQMETGIGIHVIDNTTPSTAERIGFITVKGCSQISIKDGKIYTNSYDDLVVLNFTNFNTIEEISRLKGVFTEYRYASPIVQPPTSGYYQCPLYDKFVVGWVKDSVYKYCYKN